MKRIIISLIMIAGIAGAVTIGSTGAFFNDRESSTGNTFAAGAIDLKIDNESYYNNQVSSSTTWLDPSDLGDGLLFFNFKDLKPDDEGEDTISLHVSDNDAYVCMDMTITSNDDNSSTEPELATPDLPEDINDTWDGELAQNIEMFWWADDGDNVYEQYERTISDGIKTLYELATSTPFSVALADSENNVWNPDSPGAIPGSETVYIAKAWCFGQLRTKPLPDNSDTGPLERGGTGFSCSGTNLDNLTQTDSVTMDVAFRAVQARHNDQFTCKGTDPRMAKITVVKDIVNDNGGNNEIPDFQLFVVGNTITSVTSGVETTIPAGDYVITEDGVNGYQATFSGDCDISGSISLAPGDEKTCTITNDDISPSITLRKVVNNNSGGILPAISFPLLVDAGIVPQNTSVSVLANVAHSISEIQRTGYSWVSTTGTSNYGKSCPNVLGGTITLDEGEAITCTITNDDN